MGQSHCKPVAQMKLCSLEDSQVTRTGQCVYVPRTWLRSGQGSYAASSYMETARTFPKGVQCGLCLLSLSHLVASPVGFKWNQYASGIRHCHDTEALGCHCLQIPVFCLLWLSFWLCRLSVPLGLTRVLQTDWERTHTAETFLRAICINRCNP